MSFRTRFGIYNQILSMQNVGGTLNRNISLLGEFFFMINIIFIILAIIFLILGLIGLAIPIVPQVPFFVAALFFAANGSKRFKNKLKKTKLYKKHMLKIVKQYKFLAKLFEEEFDASKKNENKHGG